MEFKNIFDLINIFSSFNLNKFLTINLISFILLFLKFKIFNFYYFFIKIYVNLIGYINSK